MNRMSPPYTLQMIYFNFFPVPRQVLRHQSTMAVVRLALTAQKTRVVPLLRRYRIFNVPLCYQLIEPCFIFRPIYTPLLEPFENIPRGCHDGHVDILSLDQRLQKVLHVCFLGVAGQLGRVVQADINDALYPRFLQSAEEDACGLLHILVIANQKLILLVIKHIRRPVFFSNTVLDIILRQQTVCGQKKCEPRWHSRPAKLII